MYVECLSFFETSDQMEMLISTATKLIMQLRVGHFQFFHPSTVVPGSNFFGKTPLFFLYSGVNAANAVNLQAKRR